MCPPRADEDFLPSLQGVGGAGRWGPAPPPCQTGFPGGLHHPTVEFAFTTPPFLKGAESGAKETRTGSVHPSLASLGSHRQPQAPAIPVPDSMCIRAPFLTHKV